MIFQFTAFLISLQRHLHQYYRQKWPKASGKRWRRLYGERDYVGESCPFLSFEIHLYGTLPDRLFHT